MRPDELTDREFVEAFEACRVSNSAFHHRDHIRLGWIYCRLYGYPKAAEQMTEAIKRFAIHNHGNLEKYHATVTQAWMQLISMCAGQHAAFEEFIAANPALLDVKGLERYYSRDRLYSPEARENWLMPDLKEME